MADRIREEIRAHYLPDEATVLGHLVEATGLGSGDRGKIVDDAAQMVEALRARSGQGLMETFLAEYGLSTREGVALMCLAEAMLRVPDGPTADDLIADKIVDEDWLHHLVEARSYLVKASTAGLLVSAVLLDDGDPDIPNPLRRISRRLSAPVIRMAVGQAMRIMGAQFVLGRTIGEALENGAAMTGQGYTYSFDMLGEAARTEQDARRYHDAYLDAITRLAEMADFDDVRRNHGISVKLSALHPRYEYIKRESVVDDLSTRLLQLVRPAARARMGLNIDAEEADRLDLSLDIIERVLRHPDCEGWDGFGVVVQAYGPRAMFVIDWLYQLAKQLDRKIMVRLVKGAYWDTEIKRAQVLGLAGCPVFTRKRNTDISYIACARKLLTMKERLYPQFATHNAHTASAVMHMAGDDRDGFEFQRLHGMGEGLHEILRRQTGTHCRIYAPVGAHRDLLAYLVRRLLENGANSSFVHQAFDKAVSPRAIVADPISAYLKDNEARKPGLPLPQELYGVTRKNSRGWDFTDATCATEIRRESERFGAPFQWHFKPGHLVGDGACTESICNPSDPDEIVGSVENLSPGQVSRAVGVALDGQAAWGELNVTDRAAVLKRAAVIMEDRAFELFALIMREAGKTLPDAIAELREAVDFLRYYADEGIKVDHFGTPRGAIACISPWNFPLAIFTGQVAAALVTGNAVIAKPAGQTPLTAGLAVSILHTAGVPENVLLLAPGSGNDVGAALTADPRIGGVCFTGSTQVAKHIERQLAETASGDVMLIAETGGLNAMIVDSTALAEQAVRDIVASAFQSAGQRCSALRMLYVQDDVAEDVLQMLQGAMDTLQSGNPKDDATDIGPVIDARARSAIKQYCQRLEGKGRLIKKLQEPEHGYFVAPHLFRVAGIHDLEREIFGPVLHVATFPAHRIDEVVNDINARGYGLTCGLHTRMGQRTDEIASKLKVGNLYVNRNQIGAVVGSQPFGGEGLSGTGPKAGGPNYLVRFRREARPRNVQNAGISIDAAMLQSAIDALDATEWQARTNRSRLLGVEPVSEHMELPGPTGEFNCLRYTPRGVIILLGEGENLIKMTKTALLWGNRTVVVTRNSPSLLAGLRMAGAPLAILEGMLDPDALANVDIDGLGLGVGGDQAGRIRKALARRDGPIIPVVTTDRDLAGFVHERAICIDTTAAGGNVALLAQSGEE